MGITWADLDTTLQDLIDKKLDKLTIDKDDPNKNKIYATNENGTTIGINYGSAINIGNRIVQVDENGNILVKDIDDSSIDKAASNKKYVLSKVGVLNTTIEESMPQITFKNNVLTITTKQQNKEG
jgi:predicted polyphosphate/ATP-dependent NAD kinase